MEINASQHIAKHLHIGFQTPKAEKWIEHID